MSGRGRSLSKVSYSSVQREIKCERRLFQSNADHSRETEQKTKQTSKQKTPQINKNKQKNYPRPSSPRCTDTARFEECGGRWNSGTPAEQASFGPGLTPCFCLSTSSLVCMPGGFYLHPLNQNTHRHSISQPFQGVLTFTGITEMDSFLQRPSPEKGLHLKAPWI